MKNWGYLAAFVGGAIAGVAVGLLTAPRKGEETREILNDQIKNGLEKSKQSIDEMKEYVKNTSEQIKEKLGKNKKIAEVLEKEGINLDD